MVCVLSIFVAEDGRDRRLFFEYSFVFVMYACFAALGGLCSHRASRCDGSGRALCQP